MSTALVAACLLSSGQAFAQTAARVEWRDERLSISAADAPLAPILREVAVRTGSRVVGLEHATERLTIELREQTLLGAVRALLAEVGVNYLYTPRVSASGRGDGMTLWLYGPSAPRGSSPERVVIDGAAATVAEPLAQTGFAPSWPDTEVARLSRDGAFDRNATQASLLGLAKSPDPDVRIEALRGLTLQPTGATMEALYAALRDESPFVRGEALGFVRSLSSAADSMSRLRALIEHEDPDVRGVAAMALAEQPGEEAERLIQRALKDDDGKVRGLAAQAQTQHAGLKRRQ